MVPTPATPAPALPGPWPPPDTFVFGAPVPSPERWDRPGIVMFFNLECAGCVSRGIPFLKQIVREHGDAVTTLLIHTAYGHRDLPREQVAPQVEHFASSFARITTPVALDLSGDLAEAWGIEGTPHWLVFAPGGRLERSIYGSQANAQTRLGYLLDELVASGGHENEGDALRGAPQSVDAASAPDSTDTT